MSKELPPTESRRRLRWPDPYFAVGFVSILLLGGIYVGRSRATPGIPSAIPSAFRTAPPESDAPRLGSPGAPIQVVELMEYQCPACAAAHRSTWPMLRRLADAGLIRYEPRNVPLPSHPNAIPAGVYARCVARTGPSAFWDYHAALLERQQEWVERYPVEAALTAAAQAAHADTVALARCVGEHGDAFAADLRASFRAATGAGFVSIPVWAVNGQVVPGDQLERRLNALLSARRQRPREAR